MLETTGAFFEVGIQRTACFVEYFSRVIWLGIYPVHQLHVMQCHFNSGVTEFRKVLAELIYVRRFPNLVQIMTYSPCSVHSTNCTSSPSPRAAVPTFQGLLTSIIMVKANPGCGTRTAVGMVKFFAASITYVKKPAICLQCFVTFRDRVAGCRRPLSIRRSESKARGLLCSFVFQGRLLSLHRRHLPVRVRVRTHGLLCVWCLIINKININK